jgi:hypothetical protein
VPLPFVIGSNPNIKNTTSTLNQRTVLSETNIKNECLDPTQVGELIQRYNSLSSLPLGASPPALTEEMMRGLVSQLLKARNF